ncbi:MAG: thioredoxin-disulfide reductase [Desulfurella sp.]|jgi:thioredoxin reductase (NADPH)|uniref:Thioredoxin reductase n=1 Tax=Desulfurella multipotens TaxID=79269 RepID=A0A1G6KX65_9BACT|nr:thioredoxin-disulfide reductase [Desulfurella multipotens]AHF96791.1 thioredoxin reductase [Desulfurella acetivorans A63]PMP69338.1 MAG: thioredoxin-disulfide reductase [Desulfurella multipotens]SDC35523.1 thioredoxin reductase (NADPH) [Desulfurella multipotens]
MYDVVIVGGGPAGLTAGIYAARSGLKTIILEEKVFGGQIVFSADLENYPGFPEGISGMDIIDKFLEQAKKFEVEISYDGVEKIENDISCKRVILTNKSCITTKTIILATGASADRLGCPGEAKFIGKGVSYCATCDGAFFKGKTVAVVGGGDSALEEALYLANLVKKIYLIHRRDQFRAVKILQDRVKKNNKIEIVFDSVVKEILGDKFVKGVLIENVKTKQQSRLDIDGIFIYIGLTPNSKFVSDLIQTDEYGYIITNEEMETNIPGIFAAGDVRKKSLRQVVTACADGAIAASNAQKYIEKMKA